ncbi:MAG: GAF domain-containing protein [Chloroflexi bacterium]|nr:GAF domain-containing protein [Chloroflexota bacterium]
MWALVVLILLGFFAHEAHELFPGSWVVSPPFFGDAYHPVHWVLSLLPPTYAAFVLGWRYGLATTVAVVGLQALSQVLFHTNLISMLALMGVLGLGLIISALARSYEQAMHQRTLAFGELMSAHQALGAHATSLERQTEYFSALGRVVEAVSQHRDMATITNLVLEVVLPALKAKQGMMYLYHADAGALFLAAYLGLTPEQMQGVNLLYDREGPLALVATQGHVVKTGDFPPDATPLGLLLREIHAPCFVAVPILRDHRVHGVLSIVGPEPGWCSDELLVTLRTIGCLMGMAPQN